MEPSDGATASGTFFKKYSPRQSPDPSADNIFFKKYGRAQSEGGDELDEPSEPEPAMKPEYLVPAGPKRANRRTPALTRLTLYSALTVAAVLSGVLYTIRPHSSPAPEIAPQSVEAHTAEADSQPVEAQPAAEPDDVVSLAERRASGPSKQQRLNDPAFRSLLLTSMLSRARNLEERGMLIDAANMYRNILSEFPDQRPSEIALNRIQNMLSAQQADKRARAARESGLKKFRSGDYTGAEADLIVAVNAGRNDTATLYALGMSHLRLKDYSKAMAVLDSCIAGDPDYAPALVGLAQVEMFNGNKEQALSLLNRALQLGGGAEFTPARIRDMISSINSGDPAPPRQQR